MLTAPQATAQIRIHAPVRAHHSRSSSVISRLASPMNSEICRKNIPSVVVKSSTANRCGWLTAIIVATVCASKPAKRPNAPAAAAASQIDGCQNRPPMMPPTIQGSTMPAAPNSICGSSAGS